MSSSREGITRKPFRNGNRDNINSVSNSLSRVLGGRGVGRFVLIHLEGKGTAVVDDESLPFDVELLQAWLEPLADVAKVECDGMTRLVSHLLRKNGIQHLVAVGVLADAKRINDPTVSHEENCAVTHCWIELGFSFVVDFRARMWMGSEAQHGVFIPGGRFEYLTKERVQFEPVSESVLELMAGVSVRDWVPFPAIV